MEDLNTSDPGSPDATISSANTSLSGLTGYEDEFNDLRHLVCSTSPRQFRITQQQNDTSNLIYETSIRNLTSQLDSALKLNEKLKNELFEKQKFYEEENRKRINSLITKNANLEAQLTTVRCHIEGLLKQLCEAQFSAFDNNRSNLYEHIKLIQNEIIKYSSEKNANELLIRNIRSELDVAKEEMRTRIACVNELKKKVLEQYASIESVSQYNKELEHKLKSVENDLAWHKMSEKWYKDQLDNERMKSMVASQDVIKLQQQILTKSQEIDQLHLGLNKWKQKYEELQVLQKRERDEFLRKIETLQLQIISKVSDINRTNEESFCRICGKNEVVVESSTSEMNIIKITEKNKEKFFEDIEREKLNLNAKVKLLEKKSDEREMVLQHLKQKNVDLQKELLEKQFLEQTQSKEILNLTELNNALQVKVRALLQEKRDIEDAVKLIRQDLSKFVVIHRQLNYEVSEKENIIRDLQLKIQNLHNQKACNSSELELTQLKDNIVLLEGTISELENKCKTLAVEKATDVGCIQNSLAEVEQKNKELSSSLHEEKLKRFASEEINTQLGITLEEKNEVIKSLLTEVSTLKMKSEEGTLKEEILPLNKQSVLKAEAKESHVLNCISNSNSIVIYPKPSPESVIMEILELILDRLLKMENSVLCKEDVNIEIKMFSSDSNLFLLLKTIMQKLLSIDSRMRKVTNNSSEQNINNILSNFHEFVHNKMQFVLDKCNTLHCATEGYYQTVKKLKQKISTRDSTEEIIKLKTQELELREKLKRYEINNHTLLRKVKELMKGRNRAEKQNLHNQGILNSLNESYNIIEVELKNKKCELQQSELLIKNLKSHIVDLEATIYDLEKQAVGQKKENDILNNKIIEKDKLNFDLNKLVEEKSDEMDSNNCLLIEYERQITQLKDLNVDLSGRAEEIQTKLHDGEKECLNLRKHMQKSELEFDNKLKVFEKKSHLEILKSSEKCKNLELEIKSLNKERWFLQRLCNDLKCALQASVNETEVLKAQKSKMLYDLRNCTRNIPVPNCSDDALIRGLIQQNETSLIPSTLIQKPLELLKLELNSLQVYLREKKFSNTK